MPIQEKATGDSSLPDAQQKQGSSLKDKVGGAVNVIHGTGEVLRGHAIGEFGRGNGNGKAIIAAGRDELQRGLDKIEGKTTATSAAGNAPDRGVGNGTGPAPRLDSTAPQATTAASRADPATEKNRGDAPDTRRLAEQGTAGAAVNDTYGRTPQQYRDKDRGTTPPLQLRPTAVDDQSVQRDTDLRQRGNNRTATGDRDDAAAATASSRDRPTAANDPGVQRDTDLHQQGNRTAADDRDQATAATASFRDRYAATDDRNVQRDTDLRQHENRTIPGCFDEATAATRATADGSHPTNAVGQEQPSVPPSLAY